MPETQPNQIIYILKIYMYKEDLALNNPRWLICPKTKPNPNCIYTHTDTLAFSYMYIVVPRYVQLWRKLLLELQHSID